MEQIEENSDALGDIKPSKHRLLSVPDTPSLRLGAGRSQVQILSPRSIFGASMRVRGIAQVVACAPGTGRVPGVPLIQAVKKL